MTTNQVTPVFPRFHVATPDGLPLDQPLDARLEVTRRQLTETMEIIEAARRREAAVTAVALKAIAEAREQIEAVRAQLTGGAQ